MAGELSQIATSMMTPDNVKYILGSVGLFKAYKDLASPTLKAAGQLGAKVFKAIFAGVDNWAERRIAKAQDLQNDVLDKVKDKNLEDFSDQPKDYIVLAAVNGYVNSCGEKELRELYANLIAKAILKDYEDDVHPAFVNIINNLHPKECVLLSYFCIAPSLPLVETRWILNERDRSFKISKRNVYLAPSSFSDVQEFSTNGDQIELSRLSVGNPLFINNLTRLGLTEITFVETVAEEYYQNIETLPEMLDDRRNCESSQYTFQILRGVARLTPLGESFNEICVRQTINA